MPGEPKETDKVILKKKTAPKMYCYIPVGPEKIILRKTIAKKKELHTT